jgi:hypothetical protein
MPDLQAVWDEILPDIRKGVTGVGVWSALNACRPVALEDGVLVLGLPHESSELAGHLRLPLTRKLIEDGFSEAVDRKVSLRVIDGVTESDWATEKRRDAERRRLEEQALQRARAAVQAGSSWETIYEQLSRKYAETQNRSLPQNRAKFFLMAIEIVANALHETPVTDELAERNFARCIERISQYCELPSTLVAVKVMEKSFEG